MKVAKTMFLRNVLFLLLCAAIVLGGFYVYATHPYVVWGLLLLCWLCYRLTLRADTLFGERSAVRVPQRSESNARRDA